MQKLSHVMLMLAIVTFASMGNATAEEKADPSAELAKLAGTYSFADGEKNGDPPPPEVLEQFKKFQVVIKGKSFKFVMEGKPDRDNEIKIDPTKSPKQIELTGTTNDGKKKATVLGIYTIEGKKLKICIDESGKARPTEFATKGKGPGVITLVFERK
jgi:uncharacterized protein (TIGR03067 family)